MDCSRCNAKCPPKVMNWPLLGIVFGIWSLFLVWIVFAGLGGDAIKGSLLYLGIPVGIPLFSFLTLLMIFAACGPSDGQRLWEWEHRQTHLWITDLGHIVGRSIGGESSRPTRRVTDSGGIVGGARRNRPPRPFHSVSPEEYYTSLP